MPNVVIELDRDVIEQIVSISRSEPVMRVINALSEAHVTMCSQNAIDSLNSGDDREALRQAAKAQAWEDLPNVIRNYAATAKGF